MSNSHLEKETIRSKELRKILEEERNNHDDITQEHDITLVNLTSRLELEHARAKDFHSRMRSEQNLVTDLVIHVEGSNENSATFRDMEATVHYLKVYDTCGRVVYKTLHF